MPVRHRLCAALAVALLIPAGPRPAHAAASPFGSGPGLDSPVLRSGDHARYLPGEVIVKLQSASPFSGSGKASGVPAVDAILQRHAVTEFAPLSSRVHPPRKPGDVDLTRIYRVRYTDGTDALAVARELAAQPQVEYAEPRFVYEIELTPNDPSFSLQTAYLNKMQFPTAWNTTTGGTDSVVIAICDGGTDWDHADLLANVWTNPGEIAGNSLDDDGNGYVDDVHGWNFANGTGDPTGLPATPTSADHGTHVAGICCAVANNATGIAGASYNAHFMPICTADPTTDNAIAFGYDGILYAADNHADIVNCSWGGQGSPSAFEQDVVNYAYQHGTAVVAAAGNNDSSLPHYPSAYDNVLSVANVTRYDIASGTNTNYGITVDVSAQGQSIYSTINGPSNSYGYMSGTSMSSPHVSATCALVKTRWPGYSPEQVMQRVRVTSDNIDGVNSVKYKGNIGYGRINANKALTKNTPAVSVVGTSLETSDGDDLIEPGETVTIHITVENWLAACTGLSFKLRENSTYTTMVDSAATLAALDSLTSAALTAFTVSISPTAPVQTTVLFTLAITTTAPAYTDKSRFELTILPVFATHDANKIRCSVTSVGKVGYALAAGGTGKDGIGFHYDNSPGYLFEGGLMIGNGVATISDGCRTTSSAQDDDFQTATGGIPLITQPSPPYDEKGVATFTDALAASPLGLNVRQESFEFTAPPNDAFLILKYRIRNDSGTARNGLRVGWFCDWDIDGNSYGTNQTDYDATRGMMYAYDTSATGPDDYLGLVTLTAPGTTSARGIWNDQTLAPDWGVYDAYTDQEKWETLSSGVMHPQAGPTDISFGLATGPFDVAAGDSIVVAFAFLGGTSLADLQANADSAQAVWNGLTSGAGEPAAQAAPRALRLAQNAPNPFNPSTAITYDLPQDRHVALGVYGVDGRRVRTLVDTVERAGLHRAVWDGRDDAGRLQASGTYFYRLTVEGRTLVRKMQLVK